MPIRALLCLFLRCAMGCDDQGPEPMLAENLLADVEDHLQALVSLVDSIKEVKVDTWFLESGENQKEGSNYSAFDRMSKLQEKIQCEKKSLCLRP